MERDIRINWQLVVEEAKRRRKAQGIPQRRLAEIAGVSAPTISRFEVGERDIQLSSVLAILDVLGMVDRRTLTFPTPKERYDPNREIVAFDGYDGQREVRCAISREALEDHFKAKGRAGLTAAFQRNRQVIESFARFKFLAGKMEEDGSILIRTLDLV